MFHNWKRWGEFSVSSSHFFFRRLGTHFASFFASLCCRLMPGCRFILLNTRTVHFPSSGTTSIDSAMTTGPFGFGRRACCLAFMTRKVVVFPGSFSKDHSFGLRSVRILTGHPSRSSFDNVNHQPTRVPNEKIKGGVLRYGLIMKFHFLCLLGLVIRLLRQANG